MSCTTSQCSAEVIWNIFLVCIWHMVILWYVKSIADKGLIQWGFMGKEYHLCCIFSVFWNIFDIVGLGEKEVLHNNVNMRECVQKPVRPLRGGLRAGEGLRALRCIGIRWPSLLTRQPQKNLNTALIKCPSLGQRRPGVPPLGARGPVWPSGGAWPQNPAWGADCHQPEPSPNP